MNDLVITNIGQLVTVDKSADYPDVADKTVAHRVPDPAVHELGICSKCALAIEQGLLAWIGSPAELPQRYADFPLVDALDHVVTPGLVDPHTHVVFGGKRQGEYTLRALGKSYMEIAEAGGGIKSTVKHTREASNEDLFEESKRRILRMMKTGTTVMEVKSGYGLDLETELRQLEVIQALNEDLKVELVPTFLGAHEIPPEYLKEDGSKDPELTRKYVDLVTEQVIPEVAKKGLAKFCDVFCEKGVFSREESARVLEAGLRHGLKPKIHAEELAYMGGSDLAGELSAVSADHLTYITDEAMKKMVEGDVVFVVLPGTTAFLGHVEFAPLRKILNAGGNVALATDRNPGSCTIESLPLITTLGVSFMKMTPAEALKAVTLNAAKAVDLDQEVGSLKLGKRGDIAIFDCEDFQEIPYNFGTNLLQQLVIRGEVIL